MKTIDQIIVSDSTIHYAISKHIEITENFENLDNFPNY